MLEKLLAQLGVRPFTSEQVKQWEALSGRKGDRFKALLYRAVGAVDSVAESEALASALAILGSPTGSSLLSAGLNAAGVPVPPAVIQAAATTAQVVADKVGKTIGSDGSEPTRDKSATGSATGVEKKSGADDWGGSAGTVQADYDARTAGQKTEQTSDDGPMLMGLAAAALLGLGFVALRKGKR